MGEVTERNEIAECERKHKEEQELEESQAEVEMWKFIFGFSEMAVIKCAIQLGIADAVEAHGGPVTLKDLAATLRCDASHLSRVMRFLTNRKIFKTDSNGRFAQTPLSRRLVMTAGEQSMASLVLLESSPAMLAPWHGLSARVAAGGDPAFKAAHGEDVWGYAAANLHHSHLINEAMACDARLSVPLVVRSCADVFRGVETVVDVGGGNGTTMRIMVENCPWIRGINFDQDHVIAEAPKCEGVEHVAGDMFQSVPKADAVFLKWVLHDWSDEECIQILKKCREAIPKENGKVIIVEAVLEEGGKHEGLKDVGLMLDMIMMAHTNFGKERTLSEWEYVIRMAGFSTFIVKSMHAVQSVIIASY